jgi:hypothetical protein
MIRLILLTAILSYNLQGFAKRKPLPVQPQTYALGMFLAHLFEFEFQLLQNAELRERLSQTSQQNAWIGALVARKVLPGPLASEPEIQGLSRQASAFQLTRTQADRWLKLGQTPDKLWHQFIVRHPAYNSWPQAANLIWPSTALNRFCQPLTKDLPKTADLKPTAKSLTPGFLKQLEPKQRDCLAFQISHNALFNTTLSPERYHAIMTKIGFPRASPASFSLLLSASYMRHQEFSEALGQLYAFVQESPRYRFGYEAIQRLYQLMEKGRGSVALKRL